MTRKNLAKNSESVVYITSRTINIVYQMSQAAIAGTTADLRIGAKLKIMFQT